MNEQTIKMTNGQIEAMMFNPAIQEAIKQSFPVKTSYWLGRAFDKVEQLFKPFKMKVDSIVEEYAKRDDKNEIIRNESGQPNWGENFKDALAALAELRAIEIDLGINQIEINLDVCEEKGIVVSSETFMVLRPFLKGE